MSGVTPPGWGDFGHLSKSRKYPVEILIEIHVLFLSILKVVEISTVSSAKVGDYSRIKKKVNTARTYVKKSFERGCKGYFLLMKPCKTRLPCGVQMIFTAYKCSETAVETFKIDKQIKFSPKDCSGKLD